MLSSEASAVLPLTASQNQIVLNAQLFMRANTPEI